MERQDFRERRKVAMANEVTVDPQQLFQEFFKKEN